MSIVVSNKTEVSRYYGNETVLVSKRDVIIIRDSARYPRSPEYRPIRDSVVRDPGW